MTQIKSRQIFETRHDGTCYGIRLENKKRFLQVKGDTNGFHGEKDASGWLLCPLSSENAATIRERLTWLRPQPLGLTTSFGFGDRLGIATPGHLKAVKETDIAPIFAQQSVRENNRTGRSPQIVLDDAMWALFEGGWRKPWGADADHVKEIPDLPAFIDAGYSFYTIDPGDYVDNAAQTDNIETLRNKGKKLPWGLLSTNLDGLTHQYTSQNTSDHLEAIHPDTLLRALVKYGHAIAHTKRISETLVSKLGQKNFDLEVSVDETHTPTSVQEHYIIARELRRLEVPFISLAPRFIGSFEKGVDYIGDIPEFERELALHTEVMHKIGGYKLSIHTGSDKFSIYPCISEKTRNLVHVKTAGTSYLEALRTIATVDPLFFRELLDFARSRYETDRATYHVSGILEKVPLAKTLPDDTLTSLFDQFDARQVMHVTFGSVLDEYGSGLKRVLDENMETYNHYLDIHFKRHLDPFC